MRVLELFSGTASFSNVAKDYFDCEVFTVDNDPGTKADLIIDIEELRYDMIPFMPNIIWASVPCTTYSVAGFPAGHRDNGIAISEDAKKADRLVKQSLIMIYDYQPEYWIIENPVGLLRKQPFIVNLPKTTVTYCQYGDTRMKKTDLFGKLPKSFIPRQCKNGDSCHESAPRGAKTGTQGRSTKDRGRVPFKLCWEILNSAKKEFKQ